MGSLEVCLWFTTHTRDLVSNSSPCPSTNKTHTKGTKWLTAGTTAWPSLCVTCTTLTTTVSWTRTTSSAWPSETPSSRPRENGAKTSTKRTRKSWPTCGTKSQNWLTSTRMAKYQLRNSKRVLKCLAKETLTQISPKLSNFSSIVRSERLMLMVTVP